VFREICLYVEVSEELKVSNIFEEIARDMDSEDYGLL
jgi:hypothetical protein